MPPAHPQDADGVLAALTASTQDRPASGSQAPSGPQATPVLAATRGLPGAGKTWWARTWQARLTCAGLAVTRVSRDDVRAAFGLNPAATTSDQEARVTAEHHARIRAALRNGVDVVLVDDTHLVEEHLAATLSVGIQCGAIVAVADLRDVPVRQCIQRDATRTGTARLGADRIRAIAAAADLPAPPAGT